MAQIAERPDVQTLDNFIGGQWVKAHATEPPSFIVIRPKLRPLIRCVPPMPTDHETTHRSRSIGTLTAAVRELEIRFRDQPVPADLAAAGC